MAGKRVKAKGTGVLDRMVSAASSYITGNPGAKAGKSAGSRLGKGLVGGALTKPRNSTGAKRIKK